MLRRTGPVNRVGETSSTMMSRASLVLVLLACAAGPARAETLSGALYVTTLPAGADVWLDGTYVGRAPVLLDALAPGRHSMTLTKTGWVVQQVDVSVPPGGTAMSSTHLTAGPRAIAPDATGTLVLRGVPPGAALELDGAPLPGAPGQNVSLPAGRHRLTATTPRGKTTRSLTILPDTATDVVFSEPKSGDARSAIVAPAEDYLPTNDFSLEGRKVVVRYAGHVVVAYLGDRNVRLDGTTAAYDGAPQSIEGKLYLPLALLEKLAEDPSNGR